MNSIEYSKVESDRFNKKIHRGFCERIDETYLEKYLDENNPDILIVRFPVSEQPNIYKIQELNRTVIFADTLVYYELQNIAEKIIAPNNNDIFFAEATADSVDVIAKIVPLIFSDYANHYFSNPELERSKIVEGYTEWALNYIGQPQKINLIAYKSQIPVGFMTCSYTDVGAEIILNGVLPEYRKGGVYTDNIRYVKKLFSDKGISSVKVSTQIQNLGVQRVWVKEGFILKEAFITLHLNKR